MTKRKAQSSSLIRINYSIAYKRGYRYALIRTKHKVRHVINWNKISHNGEWKKGFQVGLKRRDISMRIQNEREETGNAG